MVTGCAAQMARNKGEAGMEGGVHVLVPNPEKLDPSLFPGGLPCLHETVSQPLSNNRKAGGPRPGQP